MKRGISKFMYFWVRYPARRVKVSKLIEAFPQIRYYGIALLCFDIIQIHVFSLPDVPNNFT